jgi:ATP-dependent DNA helicase RecG
MLTYTLTPDPGPLQAVLTDPDPDAVAAAAVALANTDGGAIVLHGGDPAALLPAATERCDPPLALEPEPLPDGRTLVRVARGERVVALYDGQVLVRAGAENRALDGAAIRRLIAARAAGDFEAVAVPGANPDNLDPDLIDDFNAHLTGPCLSDALAALGAVTPDGRVSVAGMLLFGRDPQRWLPHTSAQFVQVVGGQPAVEKTIDGTLIAQIEGLWDVLHAHLPRAVISPEVAHYPQDAVRETLVNAVCHRDYRVRNGGIAVRLHADRLAITSPGGLPGFLTLDHLGRFSRNPRLAWALWQWGYVPLPGHGIQRMKDALGPDRAPQFDSGPYHVTVRLHHVRQATADPSSPSAGNLTARQQAALEHVAAHGSITLREFRALCDNVRADLLQRDLRALEAQGRLRKIGTRGRAYYIAG